MNEYQTNYFCNDSSILGYCWLSLFHIFLLFNLISSSSFIFLVKNSFLLHSLIFYTSGNSTQLHQASNLHLGESVLYHVHDTFMIMLLHSTWSNSPPLTNSWILNSMCSIYWMRINWEILRVKQSWSCLYTKALPTLFRFLLLLLTPQLVLLRVLLYLRPLWEDSFLLLVKWKENESSLRYLCNRNRKRKRQFCVWGSRGFQSCHLSLLSAASFLPLAHSFPFILNAFSTSPSFPPL